MRFGIHNSSWLDGPDPAEAFEAVKVKAQWAEDHGFVWFSVLDHMIQIPRVGAPDEPFLEGWTVLAGLAAVTSRIRLATLATAVGYRNPAHLAKIAASVDLISRGRLTLGIGAGFSVDRLTYASVPLLGGGLLGNTDRNQKEYQAYVRGFYDFSPGYSAFVKGSYDSRVFDQFLDRSGFHRSSNGFRFDGGVDLQLTNLIDGEVFVGYLEQHYAQNVLTPLKNIAGLDYGGQLNWYPTQLMTVHLTASHTISDVILTGVSASEDESVKLSAEYELGYNLIAQANGEYTHSHLPGSTRSDDYPSAGINLKYLMNEYLSANLSYDYSERSSNIATANYRDNMISLRITGHI